MPVKRPAGQPPDAAAMAVTLRDRLMPIRNAAALLRAHPSDNTLQWCRVLIERQVGEITAALDDWSRTCDVVPNGFNGDSGVAHDAPVEPPVASGPPGQYSRRILVVDDNDDAANSLTLLLILGGHTVRTAYDGETAVRMATEFHPEVVILDLVLPKLDGCEICRWMRKQPWGAAALIVACTGRGGATDQQRTRDAGFDRHFVKPLDVDSLDMLIRNGAGRRAHVGDQP